MTCPLDKALVYLYRTKGPKKDNRPPTLYRLITDKPDSKGQVMVQKLGSSQKFPTDVTKLRPYWLQPQDDIYISTSTCRVNGLHVERDGVVRVEYTGPTGKLGQDLLASDPVGRASVTFVSGLHFPNRSYGEE